MNPNQSEKFEFNSYELTPNDKYGMIGVATVTVNAIVVLKYKKTRSKDGKSEFFVSPSYTIENEHGEKRYVNSHFLDSNNDNQNLLQFIREKTNEVERSMSVGKIQRNSPASTVPFISQQSPQQDEQLPF